MFFPGLFDFPDIALIKKEKKPLNTIPLVTLLRLIRIICQVLRAEKPA